MRNLLALAAFLVLVLVGVGWYLGWYRVDRGPASTDGHQTINIDINKRKIEKDVAKGEKKLHDAIEKKTAPHTDQGGASAPETPAQN